MAIASHDDWFLSEKGIRDAQRHREKIDDQIRKNVRDVIGEESIITQKQGKKVRIPVKGLKDFHFKHGIDNGSAKGGVGQGKGNPGDVIAKRIGDGNASGQKAGSDRGEEFMEVEVDIDYLIKIMFEELGLPYLEDKTRAEQLVPSGWKFSSISKVGIPPRMSKKKTIFEAMKRTACYIAEIIEQTKCIQEDAERALIQAEGDLEIAIQIVKDNNVNKDLNPDLLYIEDDDLRYKQIEQEYEIHSNAVVIAMMDISGSMTPDKKYLAKSFLFWLNEFLKKAYDNVQIRFIVHTTEARLVDEDSFFKKGEWGGTYCYTAFDLANKLIDTEFPTESWNVYTIMVSDGEDFNVSKTLSSVKTMIDKKINMLGYLEVKPSVDDGLFYSAGTLLKEFRRTFDMKVNTSDGKTFFKNDDCHIIAGEIKGREWVYPMLKAMLFEKKK